MAQMAASTLGTVGVACEVKVISVDDVAEVFLCAAIVHCEFEACFAPDPKASDDFVRADGYEGPVPELVMCNVVELNNESTTIRVNYRTATVWTAFQCSMRVAESLELEAFPFDRQLFRVAWKSPNCQFGPWRQSVELLDLPDEFGDNGEPSGPNQAPYLAACELGAWNLKSVKFGIYSADSDPVSLAGAECCLTLQAERDPWYYVVNFGITIYLVTLFAASSGALGVEATGERLGVSAGLILTMVAFKLVMATSLPRLAYSTYIDHLYAAGFVCIAISTLETIAVSPRSACLAIFFDQSVADPVAQAQACQEQSYAAATRADVAFQSAYVLLWSVFSGIAAFVSLVKPHLLRPSWETVLNGQTGETAATISRTSVVLDYDEGDGQVMV